MLIQADRLHKQVFRPTPSTRTGPTWEPPVDILETDGEVVFVALPGVDPERIETVIDGADLVVSGARAAVCAEDCGDPPARITPGKV